MLHEFHHLTNERVGAPKEGPMNLYDNWGSHELVWQLSASKAPSDSVTVAIIVFNSWANFDLMGLKLNSLSSCAEISTRLFSQWETKIFRTKQKVLSVILMFVTSRAVSPVRHVLSSAFSPRLLSHRSRLLEMKINRKDPSMVIAWKGWQINLWQIISIAESCVR